MHIKSEENGVCKGFQIATQKSIQNSERDKMLMGRIRRELALVYQGTLMLTAPLKGQLALVYPDTPVLASHFSIPPINSPPPFLKKNHVELCVRNLCKNREKK